MQTQNGQNKLALWSEESRSVVTAARMEKSGGRTEVSVSRPTINGKRRLFEMEQEQQDVQFAELTPIQPVCYSNVAITVWITGVKAVLHSGADTATVGMVLQILKSY